jgi:beta-lactam-binding protein with PASTA domain
MCEGNTIAISPKTYTDVQRDDVVEFQIASMLEEQQLFILEALKV